MISCFLEILWLSIWWWQNTKVSMFWENTCLIFWRIFWCHTLELMIYVVKRGSILLCIQFLEWSNGVLVYILLFILFNLFLLFFVRKFLDSLMCVFFDLIILLNYNILLGFYIFSLDRIHVYVRPTIGLVFISKGIIFTLMQSFINKYSQYFF